MHKNLFVVSVLIVVVVTELIDIVVYQKCSFSR